MEKSLNVSSDFNQQIVTMAKQGIPYKQIAAKLNIRRQYVGVIARYNGIYKSQYTDKETENNIIELYKQYSSFRKVAKLIGCTPNTIASIVRKNGIEVKGVECKPYDDSGFHGTDGAFGDKGIHELNLKKEEYDRYLYVISLRKRNRAKNKKIKLG